MTDIIPGYRERTNFIFKTFKLCLRLFWIDDLPEDYDNTKR